MKKISFIYILMAMVAMGMVSCNTDSNALVNGKGLTPKTHDSIPETPQDSTKKWDTVNGNDLIVTLSNMMATAYIKYVKNGVQDSIWTESWLLDINTADLVVYRDSYQPTIKSGKNPDAQRYDDPEFKDKFGNMQTRHHYTQDFEFNNFTHSISGAWNTAYVLVKGKPEYFWPYDGLYYDINKLEGVGDTTHVVRNDSIFAVENLKIEYKATLRVDKEIYSRYVYYREATVKVISFVGIVEKEPEIPTAEYYANNLNWYAASGNRFYKKISENTKSGDVGYWEDGFLMSSDTHYILLIVHYTVDPKDGKSDEKYAGKEIIFVPKSEMITPAKGREYNAVMYDYTRKKYIPCCLSKDYNFSYGSQYADGSPVNFQPDTKGSVMDGVKNFTKDTARPTPWLETVCKNTPYNGKNYYTIMLKSSVHNSTTTVADASLK